MTSFYNLNDELNTSERWKLHGKKYKGAILRSRPEPTNYRVHLQVLHIQPYKAIFYKSDDLGRSHTLPKYTHSHRILAQVGRL